MLSASSADEKYSVQLCVTEILRFALDDKGELIKNSVELRVLCGEKVKKNPRYLRHPRLKNQKSKIRNHIMKKETIKFIIQTLLAILSAIATSLGVTSCISIL